MVMKWNRFDSSKHMKNYCMMAVARDRDRVGGGGVTLKEISKFSPPQIFSPGS